ncbi:MAG: zinc ribbon domain-containing protein [Lachnospiraceae bacterium]|nr:zinc ribbon domain-containing protein [Lachnospiraceae bacterium]
MFCLNCGTQLADDAVFCFSCGTKVNNQPEVAVAPVEAPVVEGAAPVVETEPVVEVTESAVEEQSMFQTQPAFQEQPMFQEQPTFQEQPMFQEQPAFQQPFGGQTYTQVQPYAKKKGSKAVAPAVIFALLSFVASIMVCLFGFIKKGELGMGLENIAFALTAIFVISYAVSKSSATAVLKGIGFIAVAALHTIYFCINAIIDTKIRLSQYFGGSDKATGTDCYLGFVTIALVVFFAIYVIMNVLRSFTNSKKSSMAMLVCAYFTMLLIVVRFIIDYASDKRGIFAFKFIPIDLGLVLLILADIFASISRAKKFED